jgi:hypothetical protein
MNMHPHTQGIASTLRAEIEAWRRANSIACMSREAFAAMVMGEHDKLGGEAVTGVEFSFVGDTYTQAKKAAQKLFRWLDVDGTLPAGIVPSILAALPLEVRLCILNKMLCPMGISARAAECSSPVATDFSTHLRRVMKESGEAQMALVNLPADASDEQLLDAHRELVEASQACERAAQDAAARVAARQAPGAATTH